MDGTAEGMALAEAAREALAKAKSALDEKLEGKAQHGTTSTVAASDMPPPAKRQAVTPRVLPPCTHEVAVPHGFDMDSIKLDSEIHGTLTHPHYKGPRAKAYPFTLDPFQETAVSCLERRESVLVSAHTSAGKTAVAEYAIAMAFRDKQRVIYTSPLKALSNQKFRELSEEFTDVGLMTGDVSVNPNSSCVVMTTEILRSMIYRGSEILREVAWVIFDEVHYMQDRERGVVWEETIIFCPQGARMVFLSATLSNAAEFAGWVASLHKLPCHVVYTDYRPTPLQHYAYATGGAGLHLMLDDKGNFRSDNFAKVRSTFQLEDGPDLTSPDGNAANNGNQGQAGDQQGGRGGGRGDRGRGRGGRGGRGGGRGEGGLNARQQQQQKVNDQIANILKVIKRIQWEPVIFFAFSRKECELLAGSLMPRKDRVDREGRVIEKGVDNDTFNFNTPEEAEMVEQVFNAALQCLSPADQELRAVELLLPMLKRGIAVHHSGLLPILKEVVELLFSDSLVKVLFTTETFAMGLNMPARTVVFTQLRKWDGEQTRYLTSGEYIQMSGRAGRRGKDERGIVIIMVTEDMDEATARAMCMGKPNPLRSSFKLSYYTMLNMMRRLEGGEKGMETVIRKSFQQFQSERQLPQLEAELASLEQEMAQLDEAGTADIRQFEELTQAIANERRVIESTILQPQHCLHFLRAGRLVALRDGETDWGWGVVVNVSRRPDIQPEIANGNDGITVDNSSCYVADVMLVIDSDAAAKGQPKPAEAGAPNAEMQAVSVGMHLITHISAIRLHLPNDLRSGDARRAVLLNVQSLQRQYKEKNESLPLLDPIEDMGITDPVLLNAVNEIERLEKQLADNPVFQAKRDHAKFAAFARKATLQERADTIRRELKQSQLEKFKTEVKQRTAVLKKLELVDEEGVVTLKGKAACEIDTADELLTVELMFNGTLLGLDHASLVALVSCLIPVEKSGETIRLTQTMAGPLSMLQETARKIADISLECKLEVDVDAYVESFSPYLMDIMHAWSKGQSFQHICTMTDIYEGSIIRATRRLDELMQQLTMAAKVIGEHDLAAHIEAANLTIRRDIIFAASLYV